jgi:hypothetical protein
MLALMLAVALNDSCVLPEVSETPVAERVRVRNKLMTKYPQRFTTVACFSRALTLVAFRLRSFKTSCAANSPLPMRMPMQSHCS